MASLSGHCVVLCGVEGRKVKWTETRGHTMKEWVYTSLMNSNTGMHGHSSLMLTQFTHGSSGG